MVEVLEIDKDGAKFRMNKARTIEFKLSPDPQKPIIVNTIERMSHDVRLTADHVERLSGIEGPDKQVMEEAWAAIHKAQLSSTQERRVEPAGAAKEAWNAIHRAQISSKKEFEGKDQEPAIIAAARETPKGPKI